MMFGVCYNNILQERNVFGSYQTQRGGGIKIVLEIVVKIVLEIST